MNPRERVRRAVQHKQPDNVPWTIVLTAPARAKVAKYYGDQRLINSLI